MHLKYKVLEKAYYPQDGTRFQHMYDRLLNKRVLPAIKIRGEEKKIVAMVRLTSKNYLPEGDEYIKAIFKDRSFLLAVKNDEEFYYAPEVVEHIEDIVDEDIGKKERLMYKGKKYKLDNPGDYQFVLEVLVGSPLDIEGECTFSDYFPVEGEKEFLSLGWLSKTGKRADINPVFLDSKDIEIE